MQNAQTTTALAEGYRFDPIAVHATQLPPRGLIRVVRADAIPGRCGPAGPPNHTLFFNSLLAAAVYQETVLTHWSAASMGHHGPFNVNELSAADFESISAPELREATAGHLEYCRMGCSAIPAELRHRVASFVEDFATSDAMLFRLTASDWFSAVGNRRFPHEWSHALLEFYEYLVFDTRTRALSILMFAFD